MSYFVNLEGGEGAGKSVCTQLVKAQLEAKGFEVVVTREPGGCAGAEDIRTLIMQREWTTKTEALLFTAARMTHLEEVILPALARGAIVICDRYLPSSYVYQGIVGGEMDFVQSINQAAKHPDTVFYLDVDPNIGLARIFNEETREVTRFDEKDITYHEALRRGYKQVGAYFEDFVVIDASAPPDVVAGQVVDAILSRM